MVGLSHDTTPSYYFYNTDSRSLVRPPRYRTLIECGIAATSGDRSYGEKLGQLNSGDILLMYEDGTGVVAIGSVLNRWDRKSHSRLLYYTPFDKIGEDGHEYRIEVNWFLDLSESPVSLGELRKRLSLPRGTITKIVAAQAEAASLVAERLGGNSRRAPAQILSSEICESVKQPPERMQSTTTRVIRDTAEARRLKEVYEFRCQICSERIELGGGKFYAEVHHVRPLGGEHKGLDTQENMLVVCPNHHAMLDLGVATFSSGKEVRIGGKGSRSQC